jgi:MFS family permease
MAPFRSPGFRRLWLSSLASAGAQGLERTATAWLALELGATPVAIGAIFAARMLPSLLFGLAAGTIADRTARPRQLLAVGGGALLVMVSAGLLVGAGLLAVWHLVPLAFALGCVQVFDTPARQALVLDTVPADAALRGLALNALAGRFAIALGALAAGELIPLAGVARSYLAVAAAYGLAGLLAASLSVAQTHHSTAALPFRASLWSAARLMIDAPVVRTLVLAGLVCEVFAFSHLSAVPLLAQDVLQAGPGGLGALNAALSIGGAVAVVLLAALPERLPRQPLLGAVFFSYGLAILALALTRDLLLASAVLLVVGFCAASFDVLQQTLLQLAVPAEQRGRAVGLWVFSIGSAPLGHLEMGALSAALGVAAALLINGALTLAAAVALLLWQPAYRWGAKRLV